LKTLPNFLLRGVVNSLAVVVVSFGIFSSSPAHADNSCTWAFDGVCDVPLNCNAGTDDSDCGIASAPSGPNSCAFAFDNDCDEPGIGTGLCNAGTDRADCTAPAPAPATGPNSCSFAFDGECDEPGIGTGACNAGTDRSDCTIPTGPNSCSFAFDNECDEPGIGTGLCNAGTDRSDCRRPAATPTRPTAVTPSRPTQVTPARPTATRRPGLQSTQQGTDTQNALNYFGFNAGRVDGQIGASTRAAIERFQRAAGYPANGRNFPPEQFGFLTGAFSWATGPIGIAQGPADGTTKLRNYRTFLQNGSVVPAPLAPVRPPLVQAPVVQAPVAPVVQATPPPPPLDPVWFMAVNGQTSGPFSRGLMGQKVAEGTLTRETMVWTAGQGEWKPANTVAALTQLFTFVPPPPPPAN
jgi:peptidoglycan hydrolase-like protein with peptidoglycan-binding domain